MKTPKSNSDDLIDSIKLIHDIYCKIGLREMRNALPDPFLLNIIKNNDGSGCYIKIYIEDGEEEIVAFSGVYYSPSDYDGGITEGFDWAESALKSFFAYLPELHESYNQKWSPGRDAFLERRKKENLEKSKRAKKIYEERHSPKKNEENNDL